MSDKKQHYEDTATFKRRSDGAIFYRTPKYGWVGVGVQEVTPGATATIYFDENMIIMGARHG